MWESRWTSWAVRPNEPKLFPGVDELVKIYWSAGCFGIGHNLSLCQLTSEDIKHHFIIIRQDYYYSELYYRAQLLRQGRAQNVPAPTRTLSHTLSKATLTETCLQNCENVSVASNDVPRCQTDCDTTDYSARLGHDSVLTGAVQLQRVKFLNFSTTEAGDVL